MTEAGYKLRSNSRSRTAAWSVFAAAMALQIALRVATPPAAAWHSRMDEAVVHSGRELRRLCLGYNGLLADIYWTRAVQYFGRQRVASSSDYSQLGRLLEVTTHLDPQLRIAYRFGAIFLAEKPPAGAGSPRQALALLRKGIVANPSEWRLWQDVGFINYWDLHDYASAARAFETGSRMPGALVWMKTMAAAVAAKGGNLETSRQLWMEIYRNTGTESVRQSALEHLAAIRAREDLNQLDALLDIYRQRAGSAPRSLEALVRTGLLRAIPRDAMGYAYGVTADGRALLSPQSKINLKLAE